MQKEAKPRQEVCFFLKGGDVDCVDWITNVQNNDNVCTALNITKQSCQLKKKNQ